MVLIVYNTVLYTDTNHTARENTCASEDKHLSARHSRRVVYASSFSTVNQSRKDRLMKGIMMVLLIEWATRPR